jgi:hypothetical protein
MKLEKAESIFNNGLRNRIIKKLYVLELRDDVLSLGKKLLIISERKKKLSYENQYKRHSFLA